MWCVRTYHAAQKQALTNSLSERQTEMLRNFTYDLLRVKSFLTGMKEFRHEFPRWVGDYGIQRSYDQGREWAHRLTFGRFL